MQIEIVVGHSVSRQLLALNIASTERTPPRGPSSGSSEIAQNLPSIGASHDTVDRTAKLNRDSYYLPKN